VSERSAESRDFWVHYPSRRRYHGGVNNRSREPKKPGAEPRLIGDRPLWTRHLRREVQIFLDLSILTLAFALAYLLRFDFHLPDYAVESFLVQLPLVVLIQFSVILLVGIYRFIWRYVGMAELRVFVIAAGLSAAPMLLLRYGLPDPLRAWRIPLSVTLMDTVLAFGGLLLIRVTRRALYERYERGRPWRIGRREREAEGSRALLVGAGQAGLMAARELARQPHRELEVVGFVDDAPAKQGAILHGVPVLGTLDEIPELVADEKIEQLVVTMARGPREVIRDLVSLGERLGVQVRIMPGLFEILEGRVSVSRFREVQIEDLLGREPVELAEEEMARFLTDSVVMVTGAGGSIGSELARQVARFRPRKLVMIDRAEPALFEIYREVLRLWPDVAVEPLVADIRDIERMRSALAEHRVEIVLHAAAHKHVPLMEINAAEAVLNNTLGTRDLARLAGQAGVDRFVLVSTDKAVNPTSVMGASKRLAELVIQTLDRRFETRFLAVRFGNVLGSTGSVVPIFRRQIQEGGPVTVTHPDMRRYFMTIPEATQLVLQAAAMGEGGEIFVLDMGDPVRILDLARDMIRLSGLEPGRDVEIVFTGVRQGEKLHEELELAREELAKTRHPKILIGRLQAPSSERIEIALERIEGVLDDGDDRVLRRVLGELLPEATLSSRSGEIEIRPNQTGVEDGAGKGDPGIVH
ncbi:MAG: nucleoside-diphosphate sugar epimerase/dehydratase, partial [Thermoanaerobaculia bacterium]|nr:nucleoside-diphosphate sugar epimerase/dehydratase [Thermoanaerobaculia bacterium]